MAWAAVGGTRDVNLSRPVGGDILPGGSMPDTDIRVSFIFSKLIPFVIRYGIGLAVALSVVALIIGGYQMMTGYGNSEQHEAALKTLTYALLGLVVALTALGIVTVVSNFPFS